MSPLKKAIYLQRNREKDKTMSAGRREEKEIINHKKKLLLFFYKKKLVIFLELCQDICVLCAFST